MKEKILGDFDRYEDFESEYLNTPDGDGEGYEFVLGETYITLNGAELTQAAAANGPHELWEFAASLFIRDRKLNDMICQALVINSENHLMPYKEFLFMLRGGQHFNIISGGDIYELYADGDIFILKGLNIGGLDVKNGDGAESETTETEEEYLREIWDDMEIIFEYIPAQFAPLINGFYYSEETIRFLFGGRLYCLNPPDFHERFSLVSPFDSKEDLLKNQLFGGKTLKDIWDELL